MGLLNDEPPLNSDEEEDLAAEALGQPEAVYRADGRRARFKIIVGVLLIVYSIVANYFWWFRGPAKFGHVQFLLLFWPPIIGVGLLWFLYRNRGLRVLLFPTGILRLKSGVAESIPWDTIHSVRLRTDATAPVYLWDGEGQLIGCWLVATVPMAQVWNAWLEIDRAIGDTVRLTPAVENYPDLVEKIQLRTFQRHWPIMFADVMNGNRLVFGELTIDREGLQHMEKTLRWNEIKEIAIANKVVAFKKHGSWRAWWSKDFSTIPNMHILLAIIAVVGGYQVGKEQPAQPAVKADEEPTA